MAREARPTGPVPAQELLGAWLEGAGVTQAELARALGMHRNTVVGWKAGSVRPSLEAGAALELVTGGAVPLSAWAQPGEVERLRGRARSFLQKIDVADLPAIEAQS